MTRRLVLLLSVSMLAAVGANPADHELTTAMETWKQAILKRDAAALTKLYHPDLTYSHSSGKTETKAEAIEASTKGTNIAEAIDLQEMTVRVYGKTALVKGNMDIRNNNGKGAQTLRLSVLCVWLKMPEGWQMVARQSTRLNP